MPRRVCRISAILFFLAGSSLSATHSSAGLHFHLGEAAGPVRPLSGVNAGPRPAGEAGNADLTGAYQALGVDLIRTHDFYGPLDMAVLYPDRSKDPALLTSYHFSTSDAVFASIEENGFEPYFRLGDSYNNARPPAAAERANWVNAAIQVLRHYRQGQWSGFTSGFRYVEIWNEPDNTQFWPRPFTRADYFRLYADIARAIRAAFPEIKIGGPALTPAGYKSPQGWQWARDFLDYVKTNGLPLDFISYHMYSNNPDDFGGAADFYRTEAESRGLTGLEYHITEWNTGPEHDGGDARALRAGALGAAVMTAGWMDLQEHGVDQSLLYRGNDTSITFPEFFGIFFADGRPKKVALAFELWRETGTGAKRLPVAETTGDAAGFRLLGAQAPGGCWQILAANYGEEARNWTVTTAEGWNLADFLITRQTVDDEHDGITLDRPAVAARARPPAPDLREPAELSRRNVRRTGGTGAEAAAPGTMCTAPASVQLLKLDLRGDLDADGQRNASDLVVFAHWLCDNLQLPANLAARTDLDSDNHIGVDDLLLLARFFTGN